MEGVSFSMKYIQGPIFNACNIQVGIPDGVVEDYPDLPEKIYNLFRQTGRLPWVPGIPLEPLTKDVYAFEFFDVGYRSRFSGSGGLDVIELIASRFDRYDFIAGYLAADRKIADVLCKKS